MAKTISIGDKAIVLPERVRFTVGDRRRLRRDFGFTQATLSDLTRFKEKPDEAEEVLFKLILATAQKLDDRVTEADLEGLTRVEYEAVSEALLPYSRALLNAEEGELDRPTSTPSTPLPSGTDGHLTPSTDSTTTS